MDSSAVLPPRPGSRASPLASASPTRRVNGSQSATRHSMPDLGAVKRMVQASPEPAELPQAYRILTALQMRNQFHAGRNTSAAIDVIEGTLFTTPGIECVDFRDRQLLTQAGETLGQFFDHLQTHGIAHGVKVILLDSNPHIGGRGVVPILRALNLDKTVTCLHLSDTDLRDEGAHALAALLRQNSTITLVNVSNNAITSEGACAVANALESNIALETLNMSMNKIRDPGAAGLAHALEVNHSLKHLDMSGCRLHDPALVSLGLALCVNDTLQTLNLVDNEFSEIGLMGLADVLERNTSLSNLKVNSAEHSAMHRLKVLCDRNKALAESTAPRQLRREVIRLHHQSHKLELAQRALREHKGINQDLEEQARRTDTEITTQRTEMQRKCQNCADFAASVRYDVDDLKVKQRAHGDEMEKIRIEHEEHLEMLQKQVEEEIAKTKRIEEQLAERQQELDTVRKAHEDRKEALVQRLAAARTIKQQSTDEASLTRRRIIEIRERISDLQGQIEAVGGIRPTTAELERMGAASSADADGVNQSKKKGKGKKKKNKAEVAAPETE